MKILLMFFTLLILLLTLALPLYAGNQTMEGDVLQVRRASAPPVIDGEMDGIWCNVTANPLTKFEGVSHDSIMLFDDHSATFRVMWDAEAIYFLVVVMDDSSYGLETSQPWLNDAVEMFFDGGNEDTPAYDANDIQWRWVRNETPENNPAGDGPGTWAWADHNGSYAFELMISQDQLSKIDTRVPYLFNKSNSRIFTLEPDMEIGFEISSADRESAAGTRQDVLHWWTDNACTWQQPASFGTILLTDLQVSSTLRVWWTANPPAIDGIMSEGEWDAAEEISLTKFEGSPDAYPPDSTLLTWKDHASSFWMKMDEDALYLCLKAYDDSLYGADTLQSRQNDAVEIFIDGGNEDAASYDQNDIYWCWVWGETPEHHPAGNGPGNWVWGNLEEGGYIFELMIPQEELKKNSTWLFQLAGDSEIGFEISNPDRESATGACQNILHWWSNSVNVMNNPSLFGTVLINPMGGDDFDFPISTGKPDEQVAGSYDLVQNYPNPFNNTTEIVYTLPAAREVNITVYNATGARVVQLINGNQSRGEHRISFDATDLASGVYFYRLESGGISLVKKMILIK